MALTVKQIETAAECFLFRDADPAWVREYLSHRTPEEFRKGEVIYDAEHYRRSMGIILSGEATVKKAGGVVLNTLGPGSCFGVAILFTEASRYVTTVEARTRIRLLFLTDRELRELFELFPAMAINYISFLSERIQFLNRKIDAFAAPTAETGLVLWLLDQQQEGAVPVKGGYTQLAKQLGIGRASLYRSLDRLEERRLILREDRTILLRDLEGLRTLLPKA